MKKILLVGHGDFADNINKVLISRNIVHNYENPNKEQLEDSLPEFDLVVTANYGHIFTKEELNIVPIVNLHPSMLPEYRGAAPVQQQILDNVYNTSVCLVATDEGIDTGVILAQSRAVINPALSLAGNIISLGAIAGELFADWCEDKTLGSYAKKITYADTIIRNSSDREVRKFNAFYEGEKKGCASIATPFDHMLKLEPYNHIRSECEHLPPLHKHAKLEFGEVFLDQGKYCVYIKPELSLRVEAVQRAGKVWIHPEEYIKGVANAKRKSK